MERMDKKNLSKPQEKREFPKGYVEVVKVGDVTFGKGTFYPGWRWEESVKPIVKTNSCQESHTLYQVSGRMIVRMDDGTEMEFGPGDVGVIPPGHTAWVVGNEPSVNIDFTGFENYAKEVKHEHAHENR